MPKATDAFDAQVRAAVYDAIITGGAIPTHDATATALGLTGPFWSLR